MKIGKGSAARGANHNPPFNCTVKAVFFGIILMSFMAEINDLSLINIFRLTMTLINNRK